MAGILVMDVGKSNVKLSLVDAESGELVSTQTSEFVALDKEPYLQLDTNGIWRWYLGKIKQVRARTTISHLCVTAHGATAALLRGDDLAMPVLDYECSGPEECSEQYDELCDPFAQTLSPKLPNGLNAGRQLFWQRKRFPELFATARHLVPYAQFWSWKLTGIPVAEVSTIGSHTDLWFPMARTFSHFAVKQGFAALVPPMRQADEVIGSPTRSFCNATGVSSDCRVIVGIHDSNASIMPHLKTRNGPFTVMSTGTWVIIFAIGASLDSLDPLRDCTANVNIYSDPVASARFMGGREFGVLAGKEAHGCSLEDLLHIIKHDIFALPAFANAGGPFPGATGRIDSGTPGITTDAELTPSQRFALATLYSALVSDVSLGLCGSLGNVIVEGAFARNELLLQCLNIFRSDQKVLASTDTTGTTMGTAMLVTKSIKAPQLIAMEPVSLLLQEEVMAYRKRWQQRVEQHMTNPVS